MTSPKDAPEDRNTYAGDEFWLAFAAKAISETHSVVTRQADRLGTTVAWLWTVYMAFLALRLQAGSSIDMIAGLPCATLVVAYVISTIAAGPASGNFDPRSPDDIRGSFNSSVTRRRRLLVLAQVIVALSAALITLSVLG